MASPLRLFRKYEYVFLVAFGIMLMIAFVVGPILSDYLDSRARSSSGGNPVVVTWKGGELNESDLNAIRSVHLLATRFLRELTSQVEVTEDNVQVNLTGKSVELIKGRRYPVNQVTRDQITGDIVFEIAVAGELVTIPYQSATMVSPKAELITQAADEEELVRRMVLADKAKQQGVVVGEAAVLDYLDRLYDIEHDKRPDYAAMLKQSTDGRLDMRQFVAQVATELSAQRMLIMSQGGLFAVPPDVMYQCYNKLNRRVTAELLAVGVAGFVDQVGEPSAEEVAAVYEEGKNRFPFPTSSEPGFKRRTKIAFGLMQASFADFLKREMDQILPTITDAEIEDDYAKNKDAQYTIPELPPAGPAETQPPAEVPPGTAPENAEAPAPEAGKVEPSTEATAPATPETPPVAPPATEPPATVPPATEPPAPKSATDAPGESMPEANSPPGADPTPQPPANEPAGTSEKADGQVRTAGEPLMFVHFQEPDTAPAPTPEPANQEPATQEPATPTQENPPAPASDVPAPTQPAAPEPTAGSTPAAAEVPAAAGEEPAAPPTGESVKEAPKKEVKYKPLDDKLRAEIRDKLARNRARGPAEQKLLKAIDDVQMEIDSYAKQLARSKVLEGVKAPQPIDFATLAQTHDLVYLQTPLLDALDVSQIFRMDATESDPPYYAFVRAEERSQSRDGRGIVRRTIIDVGFPGDLDLMVPRRMWDGVNMPDTFPTPPENLFLFWRNEVQPEAVPALEEVRDEVVRAWKMRQALPLAQSKAAELTKQASANAGKPLAEVFPDSAKSVIRTTQFSWMTRGALPSGSGGNPVLSPVNGIADNQPVNVAGAGNDFMASVFALEVGQVGTATDEAHAFAYVVRIESEDLTDEQRRDAFFAGGYTQDVHSLVQEEQTTILRDWFDGVEKELQVNWQRTPESNWRTE